MKTKVYFNDFVDAFFNYKRQDNFSYEGLKALFEYLEQYEEDIGEDIELDVIALCCEYSEMNWEDINREYFDGECDDIGDLLKILEYKTCVVSVIGNNILFANF